MIHDPKVEITCDNDGCQESEFYDPPLTYPDMSGNHGSYKIEDEDILEWLVADCEWIVKGKKTYCCEECAK